MKHPLSAEDLARTLESRLRYDGLPGFRQVALGAGPRGPELRACFEGAGEDPEPPRPPLPATHGGLPVRTLRILGAL